MHRVIAFGAALLLSSGSAALAAGMDQAELGAKSAAPAPQSVETQQASDARSMDKAALLAAKTAEKPADKGTMEADPLAGQELIHGSRNLTEAVLENNKALGMAASQTAAAAPAAHDGSAQRAPKAAGMQVADTIEKRPLQEATAAAEAPQQVEDEKQLSTMAPSPFTGAGVAFAEAKDADAAMGGPLDPQDIVGEGWQLFDADADGGLTPLEFGSWVAADAGKHDFAAEAQDDRDSAAEGTATVQLLNGTALEFAQADADGDARISADELTGYMAA